MSVPGVYLDGKQVDWLSENEKVLDKFSLRPLHEQVEDERIFDLINSPTFNFRANCGEVVDLFLKHWPTLCPNSKSLADDLYKNICSQAQNEPDAVTVTKMMYYIPIVSWYKRSAKGKVFIQESIQKGNYENVHRAGVFFGYVSILGLNNDPQSDETILYLVDLSSKVNWEDNRYITLILLGLPHSFIDELAFSDLVDKFFSINCVKFWSSASFPWTNSQFMDSLRIASNLQELNFLLATNRPLAPIKEDPTFNGEAALHSVKKEGFASAYKFADQRIFNRQFHSTILEAADGIKKEGWDFDQLFAFFAYRRLQMAIEASKTFVDAANKEDILLYGKINGAEVPEFFMTTNCNRAYEEFGEKLKTLHKQTKSPNYRLTSDQEGEYWFKGLLVGKVVNLTGSPVFIHSGSKNLPALLPYIKRAYLNAANHQNPDTIFYHLGEFFWLFCMSKPFYKGEVTIAEMFIKSILLEKGYNLFTWKQDIIPWCEVLCEPDIETFANNFKNMVEILL